MLRIAITLIALFVYIRYFHRIVFRINQKQNAQIVLCSLTRKKTHS